MAVTTSSVVGLIIVMFAGLLVWPTLYRYDRLEANGGSRPVRIHRLSGEAEYLTLSGWKRRDGAPRNLVELPVAELAKLDGEASLYSNELSCVVYNGTAYRINEIVVSVTVTRTPDVFDRMAAEQGRTPLPPPGSDLVVLDRTYRLKRTYFTGPMETGIFRDYVGFAPEPGQEWSWRITGAKGTLE